MWTEILRIKARLDALEAKKMEDNLSSRFSRVAKRFGKGLNSAIRGSVLGISLALLNKLLNPIEALEEKIKNLLSQGADISDLAEQFNTSPAELKQLEDVAQAMGVSQDQFKEMLSKYAEAIKSAREELKNPFSTPSGRSLELKNFVGEENLAKSFTQFLSSLKAAGQGEGTFAPLSERAQRRFTESAISGKRISDDEIQDLLSRGEIRKRTGSETRQAFEKDIFGQEQFGAARRFINADIPESLKSLNEPSIDKLNQAISKTAQLAAQQRALQVENQTQSFVNASENLNPVMIQKMANSEKLQMDRETKQLQSFDDLKKAAIALDQVKGLFEQFLIGFNKVIGYLADLSSFVAKFKDSRILRGVLRGRD